MLQRVLIVVLVLYVVWRLLSAAGRRADRVAPGADSYSRFSPQKRRQRRESVKGAGGGAERLVECPVCGTLVPAPRLQTTASGRAVCSDDCRRRLEQGG